MPHLRRPHLALVVETAEVYGHCAKSFRRRKIRQPDAWVDEDVPDLARMYAPVWDLDEDALRERLAGSYVEGLAEN